jgi:serine/threonine protein kinase
MSASHSGCHRSHYDFHHARGQPPKSAVRYTDSGDALNQHARMNEIQARDPLVGTRIDNRYLVNGILGRGGMGVVYDAVHEQLGRPVAIKVLGAGIAGDPIAVQRFLREARTASQLTHGNIVDVSDLGQLPDGRPYLVMPKMNGVDLCTIMDKHGPLRPSRVVELLRGAASALDLIHAKGLVHRDVKPENLMHVVREDGTETTLLLDFGIATLISSQAARLTAEGKIFGTPAYLPPEILNGDLPDGRGDVYALATMAFELMTGHTPYEADNPIRLLPMKLMHEPRSMSEAGPRKCHPSLESVIARGLARELDVRYATAGALISALDRAVRNVGDDAVKLVSTDTAEPPSANAQELASISTSQLEALLEEDVVDVTTSQHALVQARSNAADVLPGERSKTVDSFAMSVPSPVPRPRRTWKGLAMLGAGVASLGLVAWWVLGDTQEAPVSAPHAATRAMEPASNNAPAIVPPAPDLVVPAAPTAAPPITPAPAPASEVVAADAHPQPAPAALEREPKPVRKPKPEIAVAPSSASTATPEPKPTPKPEVKPDGPGAEELKQQATQALMQGRMSQAADLYAQATRARPRDEGAWRGLGLASERLGRTQEAVRAYKRALEIAPQGLNATAIRARLAKLEP